MINDMIQIFYTVMADFTGFAINIHPDNAAKSFRICNYGSQKFVGQKLMFHPCYFWAIIDNAITVNI